MEHFLTGCLQGGDGTPVKGIFKRNNGSTIHAVTVKTVLAGKFNNAFIGFSAAVGKKNTAHAGSFTKDFRQFCGWFRVKQIGDMPQFFCLCGNGVLPRLITVTHRAYADTGRKINIFASFGGIEPRPAPMVNGHGKTPIRRHNVLLRQRLNFL